MSQEFNQEDDYQLNDFRKLSMNMGFWKQELEDYLRNNLLQDVVKNAIDTTLFIDVKTREPVGFSITITTGNPNIRLVYNRGVCQLHGSWDYTTDVEKIDSEICEKIYEMILDDFL